MSVRLPWAYRPELTSLTAMPAISTIKTDCSETDLLAEWLPGCLGHASQIPLAAQQCTPSLPGLPCKRKKKMAQKAAEQRKRQSGSPTQHAHQPWWGCLGLPCCPLTLTSASLLVWCCWLALDSQHCAAFLPCLWNATCLEKKLQHQVDQQLRDQLRCYATTSGGQGWCLGGS